MDTERPVAGPSGTETSPSTTHRIEPSPGLGSTPDSGPVAGPSGTETSPSTTHRIEPSPGSVYEKYKMVRKLGSGYYGKVYVAVRKSDGQEFAAKFTEPQHGNVGDNVLHCPMEVAMLTVANDPPSSRLIRLVDWFHDKENLVIVMEYPKPCTELYKFLRDHGHLEESVGRKLIKEILLAAKECIDHGVCHSDIHIGNILVITPSLDIKLIDFGLAKRIGEPGEEPQKEPQQQAVERTTRALGRVMDEIAENCTVPADFKELIDVCKSDNKVKPAIEEILSHQWLNIEDD